MKNELYHHGIDGQRWGVTHGPPYPLTRSQHRAIVRSAKASEKRNLTYKGSKKYSHRMTDEDLNKTIERLQKEETYRKLVSKDKEENRKDRVKDASNTIKKYLGQTIGKGIITLSENAFKKLSSAIFPSAPDIKWTKTSDGKYQITGNYATLAKYLGTQGQLGKATIKDLERLNKIPDFGDFETFYYYDPNDKK
jgi:hypothetical protein